MLVKLAKEIHETAKSKGFWRGKRNIDELHMLIVTELAEAVEADRKDKYIDFEVLNSKLSNYSTEEEFKEIVEAHFRGTVEEEIADAMIRILDYLYFKNNEYIIFPDIKPEFSNNFAENIFRITKQVCDWRLEDSYILLQRLSEHMEFDPIKVMQIKMLYNETREELHGKKY